MRVNHSGNGPVQGADVAETKQTKGAAAQAARQAERGAGPQETERSTLHRANSGTNPGTNAEISSKSKEFAHAKAVATAAPDIREDRIAELKRRVAEGDYKVDSDAVAERMVDDHLRMSGVG